MQPAFKLDPNGRLFRNRQVTDKDRRKRLLPRVKITKMALPRGMCYLDRKAIARTTGSSSTIHKDMAVGVEMTYVMNMEVAGELSMLQLKFDNGAISRPTHEISKETKASWFFWYSLMKKENKPWVLHLACSTDGGYDVLPSMASDAASLIRFGSPE